MIFFFGPRGPHGQREHPILTIPITPEGTDVNESQTPSSIESESVDISVPIGATEGSKILTMIRGCEPEDFALEAKL